MNRETALGVVLILLAMAVGAGLVGVLLINGRFETASWVGGFVFAVTLFGGIMAVMAGSEPEPPVDEASA